MIAAVAPLHSGSTLSLADGLQRFPIQQFSTFQGQQSSLSNTYRDYDIALRDSMDNARYMRNDCGVMECLEARQRAAAQLKWHIEPENESSQTQKDLAQEMTRILDRIPRFTEYRRNLLEAIWYGKSAIQHRYGWNLVNGHSRLTVKSDGDRPGWLPIHGDKIVFRHDDESRMDKKAGQYPFQVGIRVGVVYKPGEQVFGRYTVEKISTPGKSEPTDRGMAYFLSPGDRQRLAIHKHCLEDGAYEDGLSAGSIHGVGIRSRIYWDWVQRQETLAFLMSYLERTAGGIEIYRYPMGNPEAKRAVEDSIRNRTPGRAALMVPIPMGEDANQYGVDVMEPGMGGIDALKDLLNNYFGHRIKRYILGQTLSTEAESTGMGSGVADLHLESFLSIVHYDAINLEETITDQLLRPLQHVNFPASVGIALKFKIDTEEADNDKKLSAAFQAYQMGARVKESEVLQMASLTTPGPEDRVLHNSGGGGGEAPGAGVAPPQLLGASKAQASVPDNIQPGDGGPVQYALPGQKSFGWDEKDHPRDESGQFAEKSGGITNGAAKPQREDGKVEMRQAKAGGETSEVDGKHYKGGQWLPVHGLYSGQEKPEKREKPPEVEHDPFAVLASEDGGKGTPVARQRSNEDVERAREQRQWETAQAGPLGRVLHLGERQHYIRHTHGSLPAWTELARSGEVTDDQFEAVSEWAEQQSRKTHDEKERPLGGSTYEPSTRYGAETVSDADWAWEQSQVADDAKADIEWVSKRSDRKILKQHPQVALARAWVSHLLDNDQSPETLSQLHALLTGDELPVTRYSMGWQEEQHPRDNEGRFRVTDSSTDSSTDNVKPASATDVAEFLGVSADEWSDIKKPGIWFRVQPVGMGLDHQSETSNERKDNGVHVVQTLEQAMLLEGAFVYRKTPHEVIVISGPDDLRDTGDVEGWVMPSGNGTILARFSYQDLDDEYRE